MRFNLPEGPFRLDNATEIRAAAAVLGELPAPGIVSVDDIPPDSLFDWADDTVGPTSDDPADAITFAHQTGQLRQHFADLLAAVPTDADGRRLPDTLTQTPMYALAPASLKTFAGSALLVATQTPPLGLATSERMAESVGAARLFGAVLLEAEMLRLYGVTRTERFTKSYRHDPDYARSIGAAARRMLDGVEQELKAAAPKGSAGDPRWPKAHEAAKTGMRDYMKENPLLYKLSQLCF